MILRRIRPLSVAKVAGVLYAFLGLLLGCVFALISLAGGFASEEPAGPVLGMFFGVGAVILMPVFYGGLGFLMSLLMAALYNMVAGWVGGIEIQLEERAPTGVSAPAPWSPQASGG